MRRQCSPHARVRRGCVRFLTTEREERFVRRLVLRELVGLLRNLDEKQAADGVVAADIRDLQGSRHTSSADLGRDSASATAECSGCRARETPRAWERREPTCACRRSGESRRCKPGGSPCSRASRAAGCWRDRPRRRWDRRCRPERSCSRRGTSLPTDRSFRDNRFSKLLIHGRACSRVAPYIAPRAAASGHSRA